MDWTKKKKKKKNSFGAGNQDDNVKRKRKSSSSSSRSSNRPASNATHQRTWAPHNMIALSPTAYHIVSCLVVYLSQTHHLWNRTDSRSSSSTRYRDPEYVHSCAFCLFLFLSFSISPSRKRVYESWFSCNLISCIDPRKDRRTIKR